MIEIIRGDFYQWDTGRSIQITDAEVSHVHFANTGDSKAVIMELTGSEAKIPDYLFHTGKQLCVYAVNNGVTVDRKVFSVRKRERPENYVYEDDQRNYIYVLIKSAEDATAEAERVAGEVLAAKENGEFIGPKGDKGDKGDKGERGFSGVYVGPGEMPEGYNVQIDPSCVTPTIYDIAYLATDMVLENVADIQTAKEFVEPELVRGLVYFASGTLNSDNAVYHRTGYVELPPMVTSIKTNFQNSRTGSDGYAFYDADKNYLTGGRYYSPSRDASIISDIPTNAKYIAACSRIEYETDGVTAGEPRYLQFYFSKYVLSYDGSGLKSNIDYNILFMGDSIIGKYDDSMSLPTKVASITGANCYNAGFSGSCLAEQSAGAHPYRHLFSGWRLADAIVSGDFSVQLNAIAEDALKAESDLHDNYAHRLNALQTLDFSKLDVLVLSYGTNDWAASAISHDNASDENPMGTTASFGGALRYFLETIWGTYPNIRVLIGGIIWRGNPVKGELSTWSDKWYKDDKLIQDYNGVAKSIAENYHIPHLDMYNNLGCNHLNWLNFFDKTDGTHPNEHGLTFMSKLYADQLSRM